MSKGDIETPAMIRRGLVRGLPEPIRELSERLTLLKVQRRIAAKRLDDSVGAMKAMQAELEAINTDVDGLEVELRDAIDKHVKESL